jgi:hypothetical protein
VRGAPNRLPLQIILYLFQERKPQNKNGINVFEYAPGGNRTHV